MFILSRTYDSPTVALFQLVFDQNLPWFPHAYYALFPEALDIKLYKHLNNYQQLEGLYSFLTYHYTLSSNFFPSFLVKL
jgi:hypothetical protein